MSKTDRDEPKRAKALMDMEDAKSASEHIEIAEPNWPTPTTDRAAPTRAKDLNDRVDPIRA
jgi:hypothetical protein